MSRIVIELTDNGRLDEILARLNTLLSNDATIIRKEAQIMFTEKQLQDDMDAIKSNLGDLVTQQAAQTAAIAALKAQLEAGTPVSQEQLDALDTEAQTILGTMRGMMPPAAPPAEPPVA